MTLDVILGLETVDASEDSHRLFSVLVRAAIRAALADVNADEGRRGMGRN